MPALAIVGLQWGDEGKGKITDYISELADSVVRFQGGANAGHTVEFEKKTFKFHQVPSGVLHKRVTGIIANGSAVDPEELAAELRTLAERGYVIRKFHISDRAHLVMPYHKQLDALEEAFKGGSAVGTTRKGIGPCYSDKAARIGFRAGELLDVESLKEKAEVVIRIKKAYASSLSGELEIDVAGLMNRMREWAGALSPFITDTSFIVNDAMEKGKNVLFEGAHGLMLDIDHGNYPYVTSSNIVTGNVFTGSGLNPMRRVGVLGVLKAYSTRVGAGPFPTELFDETGEHLALKGMEVGTTTGRRRRCGWLDLFAAKYAIQLSGAKEIALTKMDVLSGLGRLKIATGYTYNGKRLKQYPSSFSVLRDSKPVYRELPGWMEQLDEGAQRWASLPTAAKRYVSFVEEYLGVRAKIVSVGHSREQTIVRGKVAFG